MANQVKRDDPKSAEAKVSTEAIMTTNPGSKCVCDHGPGAALTHYCKKQLAKRFQMSNVKNWLTHFQFFLQP